MVRIANGGGGEIRVTTPTNGDQSLDVPVSRQHKPYKKKRFEALVSSADVKSLLGLIPKVSYSVSQLSSIAWAGRNTDDKFVEFITSDTSSFWSMRMARREEKFPASDKLLKDKMYRRKPKARVGFSPEYMIALCSYLKSIDAKCAVLSIWNDKGAMKIEAQVNDQKVTILLMPMALEDEKKKPKPAVTEATPTPVTEEGKEEEVENAEV
jgi:hypothetical protein